MNYEKIEAGVINIMKEAKAKFFHVDFNESKMLDLKGLNQLVTQTDIATEKFLVSELGLLIPSSSFITEEATSEKTTRSEYEWIIDPLDGTTNYVHNIPAFSISIALTHKGTTVAGFVYELNRDEMFSATRDTSVCCNMREISVNKHRMLEDSLVATGFPYFEFEGLDAYIEVLKFAMKQTRGLRRLGSAAVDLAYVACGKFDAFFEYGLNAWDVAAGAYIVQRAGGKVTDFKGGNNHIFGKQILAATPEVYDQFLAEVARMT